MEILNEICDNLETGFRCFLHQDTFEVVSYPDPDRHSEIDPKDWKEEMGKIGRNKKKFIEIEGMGSSDSFKVMAEFVDSMENCSTKIRLQASLEGRNPFANFKHQIDNSGEYRELWFAFRKQRKIEWIQNQVNLDSKR